MNDRLRRMMGPASGVSLGLLLLTVIQGLIPVRAPAQSPILIGATIAQSGPLARASRAQLTAYQLAEEVTNQEGGLLGRAPL